MICISLFYTKAKKKSFECKAHSLKLCQLECLFVQKIEMKSICALNIKITIKFK